jgi:cell division protein FtsB
MPKPLLSLSLTRVILLLAALAAVYFLINGATQALRSYQLGQEEERSEDELRQSHEEYRRLEALRDYLNSDEYIEGAAREQLGLVRPGEKGIAVISLSPTPTPSPNGEDEGQELWWESLVRP